ncbi:hypothetical protein E3Q18_00525 [Wallemia mellicola]|uniref:Kinetochore protein Sos7 coiled-coil domain-containing protein n=1 Tax=Wallemia mellicola TaxID=1708541 RepID=A0A4T0NWB0_9BASI|nr:hypothetical protein E3Q18_00525 [Wallemia mellicola]TIC30270.1 hypothetical protein E3Q11_01025 [Wallemia mellicola]TIC33414.1 hypothetical protein E3Q10_00786 [Wallemia mellicola]
MSDSDLVENTKKLIETSNNRQLYLDTIKQQFNEKLKDDFLNKKVDDSTSFSSNQSIQQLPTDPLSFESELLQSVDYFGKLKFKYVEQQTKENFLKKILSTQPPLITPEDNAILEESNKQDKQLLKQAKEATDKKTQNLEELVKVVAEEHDNYTQELSSANELLSEIQEMQLELAKLRATHPPEQRLTPAVAQEILDDQIIEMQNLSDIKEQQALERSQLTEEIKTLTDQDERLQPELSAAKRMGEDAKRAKEDVEDGIEDLNTWLDAAREVYSNLIGILNVNTPEPATLEIEYDARKDLKGKFLENMHPKCTLFLNFNPQTRRFVGAELRNAPENVVLDDAIEAAELHGSAPRLIQDLLYRLRTQ